MFWTLNWIFLLWNFDIEIGIITSSVVSLTIVNDDLKEKEKKKESLTKLNVPTPIRRCDTVKPWHYRRIMSLGWLCATRGYLFYSVLSEQTNERDALFVEYFFLVSIYVTVTFAAHPCENNISAALRIPLCRPYGLTEVGYRVLVPGPDPTRACILPLFPPPTSLTLSNTRDKHSVQSPQIYRAFGNRSIFYAINYT